MVLGRLPVPRRPTNLDYTRARAYCACSGCMYGSFGHFYTRLSFLFSFSLSLGGGGVGSGGAKVLCKLSVLGRPTSSDDNRAGAYCACSRCGWGVVGHFFLSSIFSFSLSLGDGPI